jgi:hypothetical protein
MQQKLISHHIVARIKKIALFLVLVALLFKSPLNAQERNVIRNGNVIGKINFVELTQGEKKFLSFTSDVKTRFILSFCDHSSETAAYEGGVMMYSSFYQRQNGTVKANKFTVCDGKTYKLVDNNKTELVALPPIRYNMLRLYINLPEKVEKVYSDNYQKHLDLKKIDANKYRLELPDGNFNYYTYENGVCVKVEVERTLFTIQFVLTENSLKTN